MPAVQAPQWMKDPLGRSHISKCLLLDAQHFCEWEEFMKPVYKEEIIIEAEQLLRAAQQSMVLKKTKQNKGQKAEDDNKWGLFY